MSGMVKANVKAAFFRMIGEEQSAAFDDLIDSAMARLEKLVGSRELTEPQIRDCEYASAALANYEHACEYASREQTVMSETGAVRRAASGKQGIEAAGRLAEHAFSRLAGAIDDADFIFRTIGACACG